MCSNVDDEMKGPDFPDTSGKEILMIFLENEFSETPTGGWNMEEGFILIVTFLRSQIPLFLKPALEEGQVRVQLYQKQSQ